MSLQAEVPAIVVSCDCIMKSISSVQVIMEPNCQYKTNIQNLKIKRDV